MIDSGLIQQVYMPVIYPSPLFKYGGLEAFRTGFLHASLIGICFSAPVTLEPK